MTGKLICEGCGRYEDECICEGGASKQDKLLPTEEEIIAQCKLSPKTVKLLRDMSEETYKEIAREIIFLAKPIILAKVKQHYEQELKDLTGKLYIAEEEIRILKQKKLDRPELREKIIDSLHWKQFWFIGQGDAIFEGSPTQESEEQIADLLLALIPDSGWEDGYQKGQQHSIGTDAKLVEEAKRPLLERIKELEGQK